jgi:hypothetical protein
MYHTLKFLKDNKQFENLLYIQIKPRNHENTQESRDNLFISMVCVYHKRLNSLIVFRVLE